MSRSRSGSRSFSRSESRSLTPIKKETFNGKAKTNTRKPRPGDNPCRIWIGGLDDRIQEEDLSSIMSKFGEIVEIKIRSTSRDTFAFVEFKEASCAAAGMEELDQSNVRGNRVKVNWAQFKDSSRGRGGGTGNRPRFQIWIGKLNERSTEGTIRDEFEKFGKIISMQLRSTSKDVFCFVEYENSIACEDAIRDYHDKMFDGSRIRVDWSQSINRENERRTRETDRYGDRDRDRYRDRGRHDDRNDDRRRGGGYDRRDRYERDDRGRGGGRDDRRGGDRFRVQSRSPERRRSRSRSRNRGGGRGYNNYGGNRPRREIPKGEFKVQIENLPPEMTWMDLKTMGRKYGGSDSVTFARTWKEDGLAMGLIEFTSRDSLLDVIEALDGHRINGTKIRVKEIEN